MPRADNEIRVVPSLLERLRDDQPEVPSEPLRSQTKSVSELKDLVRNELQLLFNTRQGLPAEGRSGLSGELQNSLMTYGLPDFCSASPSNFHDRNAIERGLKAAIERFEPRLTDVRVKFLPAPATERALHFIIIATLRVEPAPEHVTFDTMLHLASGEYRIEAR